MLSAWARRLPTSLASLVCLFIGKLNALHAGPLTTLPTVCQGLASAIDTLASQAYGTPNKRQVGLVVQRGVLIVSLATLPMISLYLNSERMLIAMKQNPEVSKQFCLYLLDFLLDRDGGFVFFFARLPGSSAAF